MSKTYVQRICEAKGIKLIDASRPIVVGVAVDDILKSRLKNSKCCAFARAAKREPGVRAAYFFRSTAFLEFADRMERYSLPPSVQKEIVSFDRAGIMAPGQYQLNAVSPSRVGGGGHGRMKKPDTRPSHGVASPLFVATSKPKPSQPPPISKATGRKMRPTPFIRTLDEPR